MPDDRSHRSAAGADSADSDALQRELERRVIQQTAVSELGLLALRRTDIRAVAERAVYVVALALEIPRSEVMMRDPETGNFTCYAAIGEPLDESATPGGQDATTGAGGGQVASTASALIEGPRGRPWGILTASASEPGELSDDDVCFVQTVANILASTVVRAHAEAELHAAKAQVDDAEAAKSRFLAVLGHELRTPLTPVLASASALQSDPTLSPEVRSALAMIHRNVELEARLLDDLIDFTSLRRGRLTIAPRPFSARALLEQAIAVCSAEADAKDLAVTLEMGERDWRLSIDPRRGLQIFRRLLDNAVKYTPTAGRITVRAQQGEGTMLRIEIVDTGIGIDRELLRHIFEAFEQGDPAQTASPEPCSQHKGQRGGLGLGLAIAQALASSHGGQITALSAGRGRGALLRVDMPLADEGELPCSSDEPPRRRSFSLPLRILLVEDHQDTAEILAQALERRGAQVAVAGCAREAAAAASKQRFELVLSDIGLPDMPGYELFRELRELQPDLPGIALSGFGTDEHITRCFDVGFSEHLTKPVDVTRLLTLIELLVGR